MRRTDRLFDIIQILRTVKGPVTAAALAEQLEVTARTVYRDIATLQARQVPVEGAAGIGYVLRRGFDLPPLMFTADELEAILVGARLTRRTGDPGLKAAAERVLAKVAAVVPEKLREEVEAASFFVSEHGARESAVADLAAVRRAIRTRNKLFIDYVDGKGERTMRTIWPLEIGYFVEAILICAWCELRNDVRHFRADRIEGMKVTAEKFSTRSKGLAIDWPEWVELPKR